MRQDQLPSPGPFTNAQRVRLEAARILSQAEINFDLAGGTESDAHTELRTFFQACADAVPVQGV